MKSFCPANAFVKRDNDGDYELSIEVLGPLEALIQSLHATHGLSILKLAISFLNQMEILIIDHLVFSCQYFRNVMKKEYLSYSYWRAHLALIKMEIERMRF